MPSDGLSVNGVMIDSPWTSGDHADQQEPFRVSRSQWEFAVSRSHPLGGWRFPAPPGEDWTGDTS